MSTSVGQPTSESSWKQEVSRRIALHQSRKGLSTVNPASPAQTWSVAGSHAAEAAARVAARYAQAPSYSEMQAADARAALRAAEKATHAALEANAAAQAALAGLDGDTAHTRSWKPESQQAASAWPSALDWESHLPPAQLAAPPAQTVSPDSLEAWENEFSRNQRAPDIRLLPLNPAAAAAPEHDTRTEESFSSPAEEGWERHEFSRPPGPSLAAPMAASIVEERWDPSDLSPVEAEQPIHANLIQFPRELVATRRMRPRRIEWPHTAEGTGRQLSIFEVDPGAISTEPEATGSAPAVAWTEPDWSGIELEPQPHFEPEPQYAPEPPLDLRLAPIGCRLNAALVDGVLIALVCLAVAWVSVVSITHLPPAKFVELGAVSAFLLIGMTYQALFLLLAETTPGMTCAGISLCTFDGQIPTREQLRSRLGALLLSLVPVGLGIAWVLFDEDHLCWHDRLSRTYLRKC